MHLSGGGERDRAAAPANRRDGVAGAAISRSDQPLFVLVFLDERAQVAVHGPAVASAPVAGRGPWSSIAREGEHGARAAALALVRDARHGLDDLRQDQPPGAGTGGR